MLDRLAGIDSGRVVVRLPNWLGDAMLAVPAIRVIRRLLPAARIELHARPAVAEVFSAFDGIGAVVPCGRATPLGIAADARRLAGAAAAVIFPNSFASALPPFLARVPVRLGAARDGRGFLLTTAVKPTSGVHQAAYYRALLGLGGEVPALDGAVGLRSDAEASGARLAGDAPYAALVPGAAFGTAKRWGAARFADLGRRLAGHGLAVLVLGTAAERELAAEVARAAGGRSLAGETDGRTFAALLGGARIAAVNDSGALHLAAALGTPLVALFGATDPAATGPITGRTRVLFRGARCSPCGRRACNRPTHECMEAVTPDAAERAALELLAPGSGSGLAVAPLPATAGGLR